MRFQPFTFYFSGFIPVVILLITSAQSVAQDDDPARQERLRRLDAISAELQQVKLDRKLPEELVDNGDRYYRKNSELHARFQTCVAALANEDKNAVLLFPIQVSGFTSVTDSSSPDANKKDSGSDLLSVRIEIQQFFDTTGKAAATIDIPEFTHGSVFPAREIIQAKIQSLLEWYFPDIQIEGRRRHYENYLTVHNKTEESVTVRVFWRERIPQDYGLKWVWRPLPPESRRALTVVIAAGEQKQIQFEDEDEQKRPVKASRIRLTAQSETGEIWDTYQNEDLWIVPRNPKFDNERVYYAEQPQSYRYEIIPKSGARSFTERTLKFINLTDEAIQGRLRYRTNDHGLFVWRQLEFTVDPNSETIPRNEAGYVVRASRAYIEAETENRRYREHAEAPLWLVDEDKGGRVYRSKRIGQYSYRFTPAASDAKSEVAVTNSDNVPVQVGSETLGHLKRGESFKSTGTSGDWIGIDFNVDGEIRAGWIEKKYINYEKDEPIPAPDQHRTLITIQSNQTAVKVGNDTLGFVQQGEQYELLDEQSGWYRIRIRNSEGVEKTGWIESQRARKSGP